MPRDARRALPRAVLRGVPRAVMRAVPRAVLLPAPRALMRAVPRAVLVAAAIMGLLLTGLTLPAGDKASAATCDGVCQLYNGQAHFQADTRFHVSGNIQGDEESSVVLFNGHWDMFYRTFAYRSGSTIASCPGYPTGIALATSSDGNTWTPYNSGLPLAGLATSTSTGPCDGGITTATATFRPYSPSVIVDGTTLRMAYENMHYTQNGGRTYNEVFVSSSTNGTSWTGGTAAVTAGSVGAWDGEVGTPALVKNNNVYKILFHGHSTSAHNSVLGLATSSSFTGGYSRQQVLQPQAPTVFPTIPSYDYGAGLAAIQGSSDGYFYAIFEAFSGTTYCQKPLATPRLVMMRSSNLVSWTVSSHGPALEISKQANSCGHDLPSWEVLSGGEQTLITVGDPTNGPPLPLVRWRIMAGAPATQPVTPGNQIQYGQKLIGGQSIVDPGSGYVVTMQSDGNLVMIAPGNHAVWWTGTSGNNGAYLRLQSDGNLVVYSASGAVLWSTNTYWNIDDESNPWGGPVQPFLVMQNDHNLVLYGRRLSDGNLSPYWATGPKP